MDLSNAGMERDGEGVSDKEGGEARLMGRTVHPSDS